MWWFGSATALLLDEPTTFLDMPHQIEVPDLVLELDRRDGRTIVMVLRDWVPIPSLASSGMLLPRVTLRQQHSRKCADLPRCRTGG